MRHQKAWRALAIVSVAVIGMSGTTYGAQHKLDRPKALALVKQSAQAVITRGYRFRLDLPLQISIPEKTIGDCKKLNDDGQQNLQLYEVLEFAGLVRSAGSPVAGPAVTCAGFGEYAKQSTTKITQFEAVPQEGIETVRAANPPIVSLYLFRWRASKVTGITVSGENASVEVEYAFEWTEIANKLRRVLNPEVLAFSGGSPEWQGFRGSMNTKPSAITETLQFKLYDDGWRLYQPKF